MPHFMHLWYDDWWMPKKGDYPLPCKSIESLNYDYSETKGISQDNPSKFMVLVHFPNLKYRQITHVQEYDTESLVGNIGGYIGLFLGYSRINFPRFFIKLLEVVQKDSVPSVKKIKRNDTTQFQPSISCENGRISFRINKN